MKKSFLFLLFFSIAAFCFSQTKPKPKAKPKTTNAKGVKKKSSKKMAIGAVKSLEMNVSVIKDDGTYTYDLKKGDKLVYHVKAQGKEYDFIVTLNGFDYNKGIDFNYQMTEPVNKTGHVKINPDAFHSSRKYRNTFSGGELNLTDASTVWLCFDAFYDDMPKKQTLVQMDNDAPETYYRPDEDAVEPTINFKGEQVVLEAFRINNKADGNGNKELWIHNSSGNPLIIKMDLGWSIELKEIR